MKCPACTSTEQRVLSTRPGESKITRLRCCDACGHRWTTAEIDVKNLSRMESAMAAVRTFTSLSREIEDAAPAHS
ncbi:transcriptional regulator NrdR [compost metagenome]